MFDELWKRIWEELVLPLNVSEVAKRSGVAWDTARKYLEHLEKVGVVEEIKGGKERLFRLSRRYVISEYMKDYDNYSVKELEDALKHMYSEIARLKEKYGAATPAELRLSLLGKRDDREFHETWEDATNWDSYTHKIPVIEAVLALKTVGEKLHVSEGGVPTPTEVSP